MSIRAILSASLDRGMLNAIARPMIWGVDDCALWCADVLRPALGVDPASLFRNRYTTPRGYLRVLKREGFQDLGEAIATVASDLGWSEIDPSDVVVGDLGVAAHPAGMTACIAKGNGFWIARHANGWGAIVAVRTTYRVVQ